MNEQLTIVTRKGQVTIPVEIRRALDLKEGDTVSWIMEEDQVRLRRGRNVVTRTAGMLRGEDPPLAAVEERAALEQAIAEEVTRRAENDG